MTKIKFNTVHFFFLAMTIFMFFLFTDGLYAYSQKDAGHNKGNLTLYNKEVNKDNTSKSNYNNTQLNKKGSNKKPYKGSIGTNH
jgi:hypothetical protein